MIGVLKTIFKRQILVENHDKGKGKEKEKGVVQKKKGKGKDDPNLIHHSST